MRVHLGSVVYSGMADFSSYPTDDSLYDQPTAYTFHWDTDSPGVGSGSETIYRWGEGYVVSSETYDSEVLHGDLIEAVRAAELHRVSSTTTAIESGELATAEIAAFLETDEADAVELLINGEPWVVEPGAAAPRALV
jgi:hypothetical protein